MGNIVCRTRNVFVTVLGNSIYGESYYTKGETFTSSRTRFIQQATLEYLKAVEWDETSVGYVLVTELSKNNNWRKDIVSRKRPDGTEVPYEGLESIIDKMHLNFPFETLQIPEGKNEQEIEDIFMSLFGVLQEGDNLYIDFTHGFRYLPMLVLVLSNYAKFTKKVKCISLTYGNFEMGEKRDDGYRYAPIIDLKSFSALQDWTDATEHLLYSGNTQKMLELSKEALSLSRGRDEKDNARKMLVASIDAVTNDMKTCQGQAIIEGAHIKAMKQRIVESENKNLPQTMLPIINKIKVEFEKFDENGSWKNGLYAASWCFEHQLYQQAITMMRESIVTYFCQCFNLDWKYRNPREFVSGSVLRYFFQLHSIDTKQKQDAPPLTIDELVRQKVMVDDRIESTDKKAVIDAVVQIYNAQSLAQLAVIYDGATNARNQYNHAGMIYKGHDKPMDHKNIIKSIEKSIRSCEEWLEKCECQ